MAYQDFNAASIGHKLLDLGEGLLEGLGGNVRHENVGALLGEENRGLETNASVSKTVLLILPASFVAFLLPCFCVLTQRHR